MVLSAVYNVFLFKYTGNKDIIVGTPVAGRNHADLDNIIGVFLNMLPMRNFPGGHKTFSQFLEEVKENALEAFENQDYPFDELVNKLGIPREAARNPLFDTEFTTDKQDAPQSENPDLEMGPGLDEIKFAKYELHFLAIEKGNVISIVVRYSTELFKRSTIEKIKHYYIEILQQVVENIHIKLQDIKVSHRRLTVKSSLQQDQNADFRL